LTRENRYIVQYSGESASGTYIRYRGRHNRVPAHIINRPPHAYGPCTGSFTDGISQDPRNRYPVRGYHVDHCFVLYWKTLLINFEVLKRVILAFIPTAVLGLLFYKIIKHYLMASSNVVLWSMFENIIWKNARNAQARNAHSANDLPSRRSSMSEGRLSRRLVVMQKDGKYEGVLCQLCIKEVPISLTGASFIITPCRA